MRFLASGFFHESTSYGSLILTLIFFRFLLRIRGDFLIRGGSPGYDTPRATKNNFELGLCVYYMKTI
jgi:hypothetical protein